MTPTNTEALVRELEQRQISNWIHSTGTPPRVNGTKPDPLCQQAAAELRRLSAVEAERDALRADAERLKEHAVTLANTTFLTTIERCAAICEAHYNHEAKDCAEEIRALKDHA